jgi:hypothetical protein
MWFNVAEANGYETPHNNREIAAKMVTPSQLEEAQLRAKRCMNSNYRDCD